MAMQIAGKMDLDSSKEDVKGTASESASQCPEHDLPLSFFSQKEAIYKCIKCLINEKEVHFVDQSYKNQLKRFNEIKSMTESIMDDNKYMPGTIGDWKEDIRDVLLRVRTQMISFIDDFTERFVR